MNYSLKLKNIENLLIHTFVYLAELILNIKGSIGWWEWGTTYGMNTNGGIDDKDGE